MLKIEMLRRWLPHVCITYQQPQFYPPVLFLQKTILQKFPLFDCQNLFIMFTIYPLTRFEITLRRTLGFVDSVFAER